MRVTCVFIATLIQTHNILLWPETAARLRRTCPHVSGAIGNGTEWDGVVETLLNRVDGSPDCQVRDLNGALTEQEGYLRRVGLACEKEWTEGPIRPGVLEADRKLRRLEKKNLQ